MKTVKNLMPTDTQIFQCELETCPTCKNTLFNTPYRSGKKIVQGLDVIAQIAYQPKYCLNPDCSECERPLKSAGWLQIAPLGCTFGIDVIATLGWRRQTENLIFTDIHAELSERVKISESQTRYLYYNQYLPLLACQERKDLPLLQQVSQESGLLLTLDGLAPQGGEAQLWTVRELRTGLTLRCGWMSGQDQTAFENFLTPIVESGLRVTEVLSDKQRGLLPAIKQVFPDAKHALCQFHYLKNIAEPVAEQDEAMKLELRKAVRNSAGPLIRAEHVENPGVLTVTGIIPSTLETPEEISVTEVSESVQDELNQTPAPEEISGKETAEPVQDELNQTPAPEEISGKETAEPVQDELNQTPVPEEISGREAAEPVQDKLPQTSVINRQDNEKEEIVREIQRRVRYLLTLKGRPPFRLAGIEMYERLSELDSTLSAMLEVHYDERLTALHVGISAALQSVTETYTDLRQAADWLFEIAEILETEGKTERTGKQVRDELFSRIDAILLQNTENLALSELARQIKKTTDSYAPGLFHTYDVADLPRTNNERESEHRRIMCRLLKTTGQKGTVRRMLQRSGAWEAIPHPNSLDETIRELASIDPEELRQERERVRNHRKRFKTHTRSAKQSRKHLEKLKEVWCKSPM